MGISFAETALKTQELLPEQKLWRGVLFNAIEDTLVVRNDRKSSINKLEAHRWIMDMGVDFEKVCYWAGFDPDHVKERYILAIERGDIWFNCKQVAWDKYYQQYKLYKKSLETEAKKYHRKQLDEMRKIVIHSSTALFTSILIAT